MRYSGRLGFVVETEVRPGIWEDVVTEKPALGTVEQTTVTLSGTDTILPRVGTTTSVTVPARAAGQVDHSFIRYVTYKGKRWQVSSIVDQHPNIVLYIGEEYHGPEPDGTEDTP